MFQNVVNKIEGDDYMDTDILSRYNTFWLIKYYTRFIRLYILNLKQQDQAANTTTIDRDYKFIQKHGRGLNRVPVRTWIFACLNQLCYRDREWQSSDSAHVDKYYFKWTKKGFQCFFLYLNIEGQGDYYKCKLVALLCHLTYLCTKCFEGGRP